MFLTEDLEGKKISDNSKKVLTRISGVVRKFYEFYYDTDSGKLVELNKLIRTMENELEKLDVMHKEFMMLYRFSTVQDYTLANMKCVLALKALSQK